MCFRPPTVETRKVCEKCGYENVAEGIGGLAVCEKCGAELPLSEMEQLQMQIGGGAVPGPPGAPGAPSAPGASVPKVPGPPSAPSVPSAPRPSMPPSAS